MRLVRSLRSVEKRALAKQILSDPHGHVWCAWCLGEIPDAPKTMELHHLLSPMRVLTDEFGFDQWVVPVHHPPGRCHRQGLQHYANDLGRMLLNARHDVANFETICKKAFDAGVLPIPLLLRYAAQQQERDLAQAFRHRILGWNAGAGCWLGLRLLEAPDAMPTGDLVSDLSHQLYVAAAGANHARPAAAREVCRELAGTVPRTFRARRLVYAKYVRLAATIAPNESTARTAVDMSQDSPDRIYHLRTATLQLASAHESKGDYAGSAALMEQMIAEFDKEPPSLWHAIQARTVLARARIKAHRRPIPWPVVRMALCELYRAQMYAAFVNWVGIPMPDWRTDAAGSELVPVRPTSVLHWLPTVADVPTDTLDIREEALFGVTKSDPLDPRPLGVLEDLLVTIRDVLTPPQSHSSFTSSLNPWSTADHRSDVGAS